MFKVELDGASKYTYPNGETIKNVIMKVLTPPEVGAKNFVMRVFELGENGFTPYHQHPWEHEVFVIEGEGELRLAEESVYLTSNTALFIQPMEWHQFCNKGKGLFKFICVVPLSGHQTPQ